jgi:CubicO group peptidase (beta-lactamase class C family)
MRFDAARTLLREAIATRAFPAAVAEVGRARGPLWREAHGTLTYETGAPAATTGTVFDLASLTKVIATTTLVMQLVDRGRLQLDDPLSHWLPDWQGTDRDSVTVRDLLAHSSGLSPHLPLFEGHRGRREFERVICGLPLEYPPHSQAVYSDLGFILLGFVVESAGTRPIAEQFEVIANRIAPELIAYSPPRSWRPFVAPTEVERWRGRLLVGEVHDQNCWALGGQAGHSGLFGSAPAVGRFAQAVLRGLAFNDQELVQPQTLRLFATRTSTPDSSRALGWDTMKPSSSCGTRMSPTAIGHTGFTGTSLWIDWERDLYVVLLTNRVHPHATNDAILRIRPAFHDALLEAWIDDGGAST